VTGLVVAPLILAGCATATATGQTGAGASAADSAAAAQFASNAPPSAAEMICSEETQGKVADALGLGSVTTPQSGWADHVYSCGYPLPMGRLALSVTVAPSSASARDQLAAMRAGLEQPASEPGLGQEGYSSPAGTVVAVKDNMVLRVDATALPDDLGAVHERRADFARVIAAAVFSCWNGDT
jgi:hypothetical protein